MDAAFTPPIAATASPDSATARPAGPAADRADEGQDRPRHDKARQGRRGRRPDHDVERRPQHENAAGEQARAVGAHLERPGQPDQSGEADGDEYREPEPLDQPDGHVRELAEQEERRHGDGVADVLVLQRAEPLKGIPQRPEPREEARGVDVHAELGVEDHPAGIGADEHHQGDQEHRGEAPPIAQPDRFARPVRPTRPLDPQRRPGRGRVRDQAGRAVAGTRAGHALRRSTSKRFQVSTSRSHGIRTTARHQRG